MPVKQILPKSFDPEVQKQRRREANKRYKLAHPEKAKESNAKGAAERNKRWYEKHRAAILEKEKVKRKTEGRKATLARYAAKVKERRDIARSMKHVETEEERKARYRAYRKKYRDKRMKRDPIYRLTRAMRVSIWRIIRHKTRADRQHKILDLLGTDRAGFLAHLERQFLPGMTWDNYGEWHVDHIRPVASFKLIDEEQNRAACHYTNLQPLWGADNRKKSAKWTPETS
jgi:hypothetical protein